MSHNQKILWQNVIRQDNTVLQNVPRQTILWQDVLRQDPMTKSPTDKMSYTGQNILLDKMSYTGQNILQDQMFQSQKILHCFKFLRIFRQIDAVPRQIDVNNPVFSGEVFRPTNFSHKPTWIFQERKNNLIKIRMHSTTRHASLALSFWPAHTLIMKWNKALQF